MATTRRWLDRRKPRDAGERHACQMLKRTPAMVFFFMPKILSRKKIKKGHSLYQNLCYGKSTYRRKCD